MIKAVDTADPYASATGRNSSPAAWVVEAYNELFAAYGDAAPLRICSIYNS